MKFKILILLLMLFTKTEARPIHLRVAKARLSLIDLGVLVKNQPVLVDRSKANVYLLSGLSDENDKSIIAVQGLSDSGSTDLNIKAGSALFQFRLNFTDTSSDDFILDTSRSRSIIYKEPIQLSKQRSTVVNLPSYINEYILAGDPSLLRLEQISSFYDPSFMKDFTLIASDQEAITDLVIATQNSVYKMPLEVNNGSHHMPVINLY